MKISKDFAIGFMSTVLLLLFVSVVAGTMTIRFSRVSNNEAWILWVAIAAFSIIIGWFLDRYYESC